MADVLYICVSAVYLIAGPGPRLRRDGYELRASFSDIRRYLPSLPICVDDAARFSGVPNSLVLKERAHNCREIVQVIGPLREYNKREAEPSFSRQLATAVSIHKACPKPFAVNISYFFFISLDMFLRHMRVVNTIFTISKLPECVRAPINHCNTYTFIRAHVYPDTMSVD